MLIYTNFLYCIILGLADAAHKVFVDSSSNSKLALNHPRTYTLTANGDTHGFINDFNITASMSLLKWVVFNSNSGQCKIISPSGKIPITVFNFAVNECYKYIKKAQRLNPKLPQTGGT